MSAVSPPGTTLPSDAEIPHVASIPGDKDGGLPPGERCYWCDADENGIPLDRRQSDQRSRRYRRHANDTHHSLPVDTRCFSDDTLNSRPNNVQSTSELAACL